MNNSKLTRYRLCAMVGLGLLTAPLLAACLPVANDGAPNAVVQTGHASQITSLAVGANGTVMASGDESGQIIIWNTKQKAVIRRNSEQLGAITSMAFDDSERWLASASSLGSDVELLNVSTGASLRLDRPPVAYGSLGFLPGGRILLHAGVCGVMAWDVSRREKLSVNFECKYIESMAVSPDGRWVATSEQEGPLSVWEIHVTSKPAGLRFQRVWQTRLPYPVPTMAFSRNGLLATVGETVDIWDGSSGRHVHSLGRRAVVLRRPVAFSRDGDLVASSGSPDEGTQAPEEIFNNTGTLVWKTGDGTLVSKYVSEFVTNAVAFDATGNVLNGDEAGRVEWLGAAGSRSAGGSDLQPVAAAGFLADSLLLAVDRKLLRVSLEDGSVRGLGDAHRAPISRLAVSATRGEIATLAAADLRITSGVNGSVLDQVDLGSLKPTALAFSPDGSSLAVGGSDSSAASGAKQGRISFFDRPVGSERRVVAQWGQTLDLAYDSTGSLVAAGSIPFQTQSRFPDDETTLTFWNPRDGQQIKTEFPRQLARVAAVRFSPDGHYLATGRASWDATSAAKNMLTLASETLSQDGKPISQEVLTPPDTEELPQHDLVMWDRNDALLHTERYSGIVNALAIHPDSRLLVTGGMDGSVRFWNATSGTVENTVTQQVGGIQSLEFNSSGSLLASVAQDGVATLWSVATRSPIAKINFAARDHWLVTLPDGRFDTDNLDHIAALRWVFADDPLRALAPEVFMRDYYEPGLLPRLLAGKLGQPPKRLDGLNRVQPTVEVVRVDWQDEAQRLACVTVRVAESSDFFPRGERSVKLTSGVHDLRVFRDGQLVGWEPKSSQQWELALRPVGAQAIEQDLASWRDHTRMKLQADGARLLSFPVRVPRNTAAKEVSFSAYAFNSDRVKSETAERKLPIHSPPEPRLGRAYVITVGVNKTESSPNWDLRFAANDARKLNASLTQKLRGTGRYAQGQVVGVRLISDTADQPGESQAIKRHLKDLLDVLAGRRSVDAQLQADIPDAAGLQKAQPEDLIVLGFSSHGFTDSRGVFHFVLADIGAGQPRDHVTEDLRRRSLSSDELSVWLRDVDAGELVMIVDSCHSEATVAYEGFKPGPMGSRGLGQLAYDKGMRILAASKSNQSAVELGDTLNGQRIDQGLLTYVLVQEGLERGAADFTPSDGKIWLSKWLQYAAREVPKLISEGRLKGPGAPDPLVAGTRDAIRLGSAPLPVQYQQPVLFDFSRGRPDVMIGLHE